jgi:small subunit ribosomal protein S9
LSDDPTQDEGQAPEEEAPVEEPSAPEEAVPAEDPPSEVPDDADVAPAGEPDEQAAPPDEAPTEEPVAEAPAEDAPQEEAPAEEESAEESEADEAPAEAPADPAPAEEVPAADEPAKAPAADAKKKDVAPGADLEPLLIEEERELSAEERARLEAEREEAEAAAAAETDVVADEPAIREGAKLDLPEGTRIQATGKRKTAIARVVVGPGKGAFLVNRKEIGEYFPRSLHQTIARQALVTSGYDSQVDVKVRVHGGGVSGQADAVRHATARALIEIDPELRGELKRRGMLTRDAREKERRKAGLKKARKRPQFSKR